MAYLSEHQLTVQRKSSELAGKMSALEASLHAAEHQLKRIKRVHHAQALATADHPLSLTLTPALALTLTLVLSNPSPNPLRSNPNTVK